MENLGKHLQAGLACTENDVISHATDLFRPIAKEISMRDSQIVYITPTSVITQAGPYDFQISQMGDSYIQANQIRLYMKAKVVTSTGDDITEDDGVGVANLLGNSMFKTIQVSIGSKNITDLENTHANYKAYLETLLSYAPHKDGGGHLAASCWALDTAGHFGDVNYGDGIIKQAGSTTAIAPNTKNVGLQNRRALIKDSKERDLMFPIHCDFFNCDRLMPPGLDISLKLIRASDSFVLMHPAHATKSYKIILSEICLHVPYISVAEAIVANHRRLAATQPVLMPIKKTEVLIQHIPAGGRNVLLANLFQNRLPKTLLIGMLGTANYNGDSGLNPYNFQHFGVNHIQITKNGVAIPPQPYIPNWAEGQFVREYRSFFDNT